MSELKKCPMCNQDACINLYEHRILGDRRKTAAVCCDCGFTCWESDWKILTGRRKKTKRKIKELEKQIKDLHLPEPDEGYVLKLTHGVRRRNKDTWTLTLSFEQKPLWTPADLDPPAHVWIYTDEGGFALECLDCKELDVNCTRQPYGAYQQRWCRHKSKGHYCVYGDAYDNCIGYDKCDKYDPINKGADDE